MNFASINRNTREESLNRSFEICFQCKPTSLWNNQRTQDEQWLLRIVEIHPGIAGLIDVDQVRSTTPSS